LLNSYFNGVEINDSLATHTGYSDGQNLSLRRIEPADLQYLLATFVTVDDARRRLQLHSVDHSSGDVQLGPIRMTDREKAAALNLAGQLVDRSRWREILQCSQEIV
jgi:hypothetical protein